MKLSKVTTLSMVTAALPTLESKEEGLISDYLNPLLPGTGVGCLPPGLDLCSGVRRGLHLRQLPGSLFLQGEETEAVKKVMTITLGSSDPRPGVLPLQLGKPRPGPPAPVYPAPAQAALQPQDQGPNTQLLTPGWHILAYFWLNFCPKLDINRIHYYK